MTAHIVRDTSSAQSGPTTGSVVVEVRRMDEGTTLEGVLVSAGIPLAREEEWEAALTDDTGTATLGLPPGTHSIEVSHPGFRGGTVPVHVRPGTLQRLLIALDVQAVCD